eukprot:CAMPEP_0174722794 /NCGR_PEP_ID=MMETSP1094-20130205/39291_1 /TAXON_ID=156173 /ORGANISM="Chrysochromulina brevifilum, Strain UTEX LB 985" /LENGTH=40 /DNA_ID= /DNA_START= /DNA_END= /DNA_ORIENTATION=
MTFARVWTGFKRQEGGRLNIEAPRHAGTANLIDPSQMNAA